ncbi:hypothetical protein PVBG_05478 [Plasmodium vivax Brazil I]|uniref:VIR protein n=1 Tax=Plasmodium vivax (strain Brazil I) TaxID=1033975 RepID=A0A0J9ST49_PLAV1|nr:hypothetical protein PVBG_05478 [Plasmodium vivax Brazil I]
MENPTIEDLVINYYDYKNITEGFNKNPYYVYDEKYDVVFKDANPEEFMREKYYKTYEEVYRNLSNHGVMMKYMEQGCKYISYLLHKRVKDEHNQYYNLDTFKILHKYVEYYYKHKYSIRDNKCLPHISYVNHDMYAKLDTIYGLYKQYIDVLSMKNPWDDDKKCSSLKFFINQYNDYMKNKKPTSLELKKILENFEGHIKHTLGIIDNKCSNYTYPLEDIELYKPPVENKPSRIRESTPLQSQELQPQVENRGERAPNREVPQLTLPPPPPLASESDITHVAETDLRLGRGPDSVREQIRAGEHEAQELHDYRTQSTHVLNETMGPGYRPTVQSSEQLKLMGEQSLYSQNGLEKDQGFMANMRNTITGVLGEVDPVPVVGVSGGMGALFLLFRVLEILNLDPYIDNIFI